MPSGLLIRKRGCGGGAGRSLPAHVGQRVFPSSRRKNGWPEMLPKPTSGRLANHVATVIITDGHEAGGISNRNRAAGRNSGLNGSTVGLQAGLPAETAEELIAGQFANNRSVCSGGPSAGRQSGAGLAAFLQALGRGRSRIGVRHRIPGLEQEDALPIPFR